MPRGILIGRLLRTDVYATPGFALLLVFYFVINGAENVAGTAVFCLAVVASLLVHEFGHVTAVRWLLRADSVVILWGLGGLCVHEPARRPGHKVAISLMGPLFGGVLGGLAYGAFRLAPPLHPLVTVLLQDLVWIGLVWTAFNLLPVRPLDGGQALLAALEAPLGPVRAAHLARRISLVVAAVVVAAAVAFNLLFVALIGVLLLSQNLNRGGPRL